ncbi:hypothetical protein [Dysosmobacter sp.]|uniref:hypothetical protein n=1 Tax=Dysosmobacter sp. TaxID=2591382 RepID=UPI002A89CC99|nr:hypothetical protein [Dysosmobacter sp.]MDY3282555.1 hypothetical protein [Dysosmobacter sp.]
MLKLMEFLFHTLPLLLAWLYLLAAVFCAAALAGRLRKGERLPAGQWAFLILNGGYVLFFLITRLFFPDLWERVFSGAGVLAILISFVWSRYEDRRSGRRWWNW